MLWAIASAFTVVILRSRARGSSTWTSAKVRPVTGLHVAPPSAWKVCTVTQTSPSGLGRLPVK